MNYQQLMEYSTNMLATMIKERGARANQRLRELEKQGLTNSSNAYRWLERTAAKYDVVRHTKRGDIRFSLKTEGLDKQKLASHLARIETFLEAKTSGKAGINKAYKKAWQAFTSNPANNAKGMSFNTYIDMMETTGLESFKKQFYSSFKIIMSNAAKRGGEKVHQWAEIMRQGYGSEIDIRKSVEDIGGIWYHPEDFMPENQFISEEDWKTLTGEDALPFK